jgi:hypothetical protein
VGGAADTEGAGAMRAVGLGGGLATLILSPIFFGVMGFIGGLISTLLANLAMKLAGGLEIEFEE